MDDMYIYLVQNILLRWRIYNLDVYKIYKTTYCYNFYIFGFRVCVILGYGSYNLINFIDIYSS